MKPVPEKKPFFIDSTVRKNTSRNAQTSLLLALCLFFSTSLFSDVEANNLSIMLQQTPVKAKVKTAPKTTKKNKAKIKGRKSKTALKDTLRDIDPANTSSPLYQKTNNK